MANVKVAVRVRPLLERELEKGAKMIVNVKGDKINVINPKIPENSDVDSRERIKQFSFDYCYWSDLNCSEKRNESQELIFQDLGSEVLEAICDGYNACVLAYGQSGSGKTYTMMGRENEVGLIPRICKELFSKINDIMEDRVTFHIDVSYLEIYNEKVQDLLQSPLNKKKQNALKVREHPKQGTYVQDLSRHKVQDFHTVLTLIDKGNENRSIAATENHQHSSRSHAIFTINCTQARLDADLPSEIISKIHLVDLAGSERASSTFNKLRLKESSNINKSLVTLGNVISALADKSLSTWSLDSLGSSYSINSSAGESVATSPLCSPRRLRQPFVPYRDSILTWLLKDSLGGNSKTIMITTLSPAGTCYNETINTLRYAQRTKCIVNRPVVNEDPNVKLIRQLRTEIFRLRKLLVAARTNNMLPSTVDENSISEILNQNENKAKALTKSWIEKWKYSLNFVEEPCANGFHGNNINSVVTHLLPHFIVLDNHVLSTGIHIYYLKKGRTIINKAEGFHNEERDAGINEVSEYCQLEYDGQIVKLYPTSDGYCQLNGITVTEAVQLRQADIIKLGNNYTLRFNHPSEVQKLTEEWADDHRISDTLQLEHISRLHEGGGPHHPFGFGNNVNWAVTDGHCNENAQDGPPCYKNGFPLANKCNTLNNHYASKENMLNLLNLTLPEQLVYEDTNTTALLGSTIANGSACCSCCCKDRDDGSPKLNPAVSKGGCYQDDDFGSSACVKYAPGAAGCQLNQLCVKCQNKDFCGDNVGEEFDRKMPQRKEKNPPYRILENGTRSSSSSPSPTALSSDINFINHNKPYISSPLATQNGEYVNGTHSTENKLHHDHNTDCINNGSLDVKSDVQQPPARRMVHERVEIRHKHCCKKLGHRRSCIHDVDCMPDFVSPQFPSAVPADFLPYHSTPARCMATLINNSDSGISCIHSASPCDVNRKREEEEEDEYEDWDASRNCPGMNAVVVVGGGGSTLENFSDIHQETDSLVSMLSESYSESSCSSPSLSCPSSERIGGKVDRPRTAPVTRSKPSECRPEDNKAVDARVLSESDIPSKVSQSGPDDDTGGLTNLRKKAKCVSPGSESECLGVKEDEGKTKLLKSMNWKYKKLVRAQNENGRPFRSAKRLRVLCVKPKVKIKGLVLRKQFNVNGKIKDLLIRAYLKNALSSPERDGSNEGNSKELFMDASAEKTSVDLLRADFKSDANHNPDYVSGKGELREGEPSQYVAKEDTFNSEMLNDVKNFVKFAKDITDSRHIMKVLENKHMKQPDGNKIEIAMMNAIEDFQVVRDTVNQECPRSANEVFSPVLCHSTGDEIKNKMDDQSTDVIYSDKEERFKLDLPGLSTDVDEIQKPLFKSEDLKADANENFLLNSSAIVTIQDESPASSGEQENHPKSIDDLNYPFIPEVLLSLEPDACNLPREKEIETIPVAASLSLLNVAPADTELKRSLSNTDIQQALLEDVQDADGAAMDPKFCPTLNHPPKVRTNSWPEPSQLSLEQLDSEIRDLQEGLKEDLVNDMLTKIVQEGAVGDVGEMCPSASSDTVTNDSGATNGFLPPSDAQEQFSDSLEETDEKVKCWQQRKNSFSSFPWPRILQSDEPVPGCDLDSEELSLWPEEENDNFSAVSSQVVNRLPSKKLVRQRARTCLSVEVPPLGHDDNQSSYSDDSLDGKPRKPVIRASPSKRKPNLTDAISPKKQTDSRRKKAAQPLSPNCSRRSEVTKAESHAQPKASIKESEKLSDHENRSVSKSCLQPLHIVINTPDNLSSAENSVSCQRFADEESSIVYTDDFESDNDDENDSCEENNSNANEDEEIEEDIISFSDEEIFYIPADPDNPDWSLYYTSANGAENQVHHKKEDSLQFGISRPAAENNLIDTTFDIGISNVAENLSPINGMMRLRNPHQHVPAGPNLMLGFSDQPSGYVFDKQNDLCSPQNHFSDFGSDDEFHSCQNADSTNGLTSKRPQSLEHDLLGLGSDGDDFGQEDDMFDNDSSVVFTALPSVDILIDYRMMSPQDRRRLYTIPEMSSEYSSTPSDGIMGDSVSELESLHAVDDQLATPNDDVFEGSSLSLRLDLPREGDEFGDDEKKYLDNRFATEEVQQMEGGCEPIKEAGGLNESGFILDKESGGGDKVGSTENMSIAKSIDSGQLMSQANELVPVAEVKENVNLLGSLLDDDLNENGVDCTELWKLYKRFSEESDEEEQGKNGVDKTNDLLNGDNVDHQQMDRKQNGQLLGTASQHSINVQDAVQETNSCLDAKRSAKYKVDDSKYEGIIFLENELLNGNDNCQQGCNSKETMEESSVNELIVVGNEINNLTHKDETNVESNLKIIENTEPPVVSAIDENLKYQELSLLNKKLDEKLVIFTDDPENVENDCYSRDLKENAKEPEKERFVFKEINPSFHLVDTDRTTTANGESKILSTVYKPLEKINAPDDAVGVRKIVAIPGTQNCTSESTFVKEILISFDLPSEKSSNVVRSPSHNNFTNRSNVLPLGFTISPIDIYRTCELFSTKNNIFEYNPDVKDSNRFCLSENDEKSPLVFMSDLLGNNVIVNKMNHLTDKNNCISSMNVDSSLSEDSNRNSVTGIDFSTVNDNNNHSSKVANVNNSQKDKSQQVLLCNKSDIDKPILIESRVEDETAGIKSMSSSSEEKDSGIDDSVLNASWCENNLPGSPHGDIDIIQLEIIDSDKVEPSGIEIVKGESPAENKTLGAIEFNVPGSDLSQTCGDRHCPEAIDFDGAKEQGRSGNWLDDTGMDEENSFSDEWEELPPIMDNETLLMQLEDRDVASSLSLRRKSAETGDPPPPLTGPSLLAVVTFDKDEPVADDDAFGDRADRAPWFGALLKRDTVSPERCCEEEAVLAEHNNLCPIAKQNRIDFREWNLQNGSDPINEKPAGDAVIERREESVSPTETAPADEERTQFYFHDKDNSVHVQDDSWRLKDSFGAPALLNTLSSLAGLIRNVAVDNLPPKPREPTAKNHGDEYNLMSEENAVIAALGTSFHLDVFGNDSDSWEEDKKRVTEKNVKPINTTDSSGKHNTEYDKTGYDSCASQQLSVSASNRDRTVRENSITPDSLENVGQQQRCLTSWQQPNPPGQNSLFNVRNSATVDRNLFQQREFGSNFDDFWGASSDSITFVFLGPGIHASNKSRSDPSATDGFFDRHDDPCNLMLRSASLDCINNKRKRAKMLPYTLNLRASSMESMIPDELMGLVEQSRLHDIDPDEIKGQAAAGLARRGSILASKARSQGSVAGTSTNARKTKKSVSWGDLSGCGLTKEEGTDPSTLRLSPSRLLKPIIKCSEHVSPQEYYFGQKPGQDRNDEHQDYTEHDVEEELKRSALFARIEKKCGFHGGRESAPPPPSFALQLPSRIKDRMKRSQSDVQVSHFAQSPLSIDVDCGRKFTSNAFDFKSNGENVNNREFNSLPAKREVFANPKNNLQQSTSPSPLSQLLRNLITSPELMSLSNRMDACQAQGSASGCEELSSLLLDASNIFRQLSQLCSTNNSSGVPASQPDKKYGFTSVGTATCTDSATQTDAVPFLSVGQSPPEDFVPVEREKSDSECILSLLEDEKSVLVGVPPARETKSLPSWRQELSSRYLANGTTAPLGWKGKKPAFGSNATSIHRLVESDSLAGSPSPPASVVGQAPSSAARKSVSKKSWLRREACLRKELEILMQEKKRILCQLENRYVSGDDDSPLSPDSPDVPQYLFIYYERLQKACARVAAKLEKLARQQRPDDASQQAAHRQRLWSWSSLSPSGGSTQSITSSDYLPVRRPTDGLLTPTPSWANLSQTSSGSNGSPNHGESQRLRPRDYRAQLVNFRRDLVAVASQGSGKSTSTSRSPVSAFDKQDAFLSSPLLLDSAAEDVSSTEDSAEDIQALLLECRTARARAQKEIELAQEQLSAQRRAVQNLETMLKRRT